MLLIGLCAENERPDLDLGYPLRNENKCAGVDRFMQMF